MRAIAVAICLLGVFGVSSANICMRRVGTQAHVMHSITYFTAWCLLMSVTSMAALNIPWVLPPNPGLWLLGVIAVGSLGFMGQVFATRAFQLVSAGRGSLASYTAIVWSLILQNIFFHVKVSRLSLIGSAIVLTSAVYVTVTKPALASSLSSTKDQRMLDEAMEGEDVGLMPMLDDDHDTDDEDEDIEAQTPVTPKEYRPILSGMPGISMEMKEINDQKSDVEVRVPLWLDLNGRLAALSEDYGCVCANSGFPQCISQTCPNEANPSDSYCNGEGVPEGRENDLDGFTETITSTMASTTTTITRVYMTGIAASSIYSVSSMSSASVASVSVSSVSASATHNNAAAAAQAGGLSGIVTIGLGPGIENLPKTRIGNPAVDGEAHMPLGGYRGRESLGPRHEANQRGDEEPRAVSGPADSVVGYHAAVSQVIPDIELQDARSVIRADMVSNPMIVVEACANQLFDNPAYPKALQLNGGPAGDDEKQDMRVKRPKIDWNSLDRARHVQDSHYFELAVVSCMRRHAYVFGNGVLILCRLGHPDQLGLDFKYVLKTSIRHGLRDQQGLYYPTFFYLHREVANPGFDLKKKMETIGKYDQNEEISCEKHNAEEEIGKREYTTICVDGSGRKLEFPQSEQGKVLDPKALDLFDRVRAERAVVDAGFKYADRKLDARHTVEEAMTAALIRKCPKCSQIFMKESSLCVPFPPSTLQLSDRKSPVYTHTVQKDDMPDSKLLNIAMLHLQATYYVGHALCYCVCGPVV
ncbi:hypothetical protein FRB97_008991 [Tulasnella sp. 331]|nr:hypothetical protein FRB97_008991 [Tulasnella sp. 331]